MQVKVNRYDNAALILSIRELSDTDMKSCRIYRSLKESLNLSSAKIKNANGFFFDCCEKKTNFVNSFNLFIRCIYPRRVANNAFHYFSDNLQYIIAANLLDKGIMDTIKFQTKYPRLQI